MNYLEENHDDALSIFTQPPSNTAIQRREWFEYRPVNQITDYADLDFFVPPQAAGYMDLKRSTIKVKIRLTDATDTPIAKDENVGLVNLPLHALFTQVDCSLQQTGVGQTGNNYPYKAYIDTLMSTSPNDKIGLESQLFVKDTAGHDDPDDRNGGNNGLIMRSMYTNKAVFGIRKTRSSRHFSTESINHQWSESVPEVSPEQKRLPIDVERRQCRL